MHDIRQNHTGEFLRRATLASSRKDYLVIHIDACKLYVLEICSQKNIFSAKIPSKARVQAYPRSLFVRVIFLA